MIRRLETRPVHDRLPDLYRRLGGEVLSRYVEIAEDLLGGLELEGTPDLRDIAGRLRPRGEVRQMGAWRGTARGLAQDLRALGLEPRIWPSLTVSFDGTGTLRFARSRGRSIVLAWLRDEVPEAPERSAVVEVLERHRPPGCEIRGVWLDGARSVLPPLAGAVVRGMLVF